MAFPYRILIAGLGARVEEYLISALEAEGYQVEHCVGFEALLETLNRSLDLVLLDVPSDAEIGLVAAVSAACTCALVVVGPSRDDRLLISALEQGADDYVQRPFRTTELLARLRAQLRRRQRSDGFALTFGELSFDSQGRQAFYAGRALDLSADELTLLTLLAARPGNLYPAEFIAEQLWGHARRDERARLASVIARLRSLIEPDPTSPSVLGGDLGRGYWLGGAVRERQLNGGAEGGG